MPELKSVVTDEMADAGGKVIEELVEIYDPKSLAEQVYLAMSALIPSQTNFAEAAVSCSERALAYYLLDDQAASLAWSEMATLLKSAGYLRLQQNFLRSSMKELIEHESNKSKENNLTNIKHDEH